MRERSVAFLCRKYFLLLRLYPCNKWINLSYYTTKFKLIGLLGKSIYHFEGPNVHYQVPFRKCFHKSHIICLFLLRLGPSRTLWFLQSCTQLSRCTVCLMLPSLTYFLPCAYQRTLPALLSRPGLCKRLLTQELATFLGRSPHFYCLLLLLCTHPCHMWGSEVNAVGSLLYLHWNTTASHTTDSTGLVKVESGGHVPAPHFCVTQLRHSFDAVYTNLDLSRGSGTAVSQQASSRGYGTPLDSRSGAC